MVIMLKRMPAHLYDYWETVLHDQAEAAINPSDAG